jgi:hypothetical protein
MQPCDPPPSTWQTPQILLSDGEKSKLVVCLLSQRFIMFNNIGSRRGSAPPPYTGPSSRLSSPAQALYRGNPGYGDPTPDALDRHPRHAFESTPLSFSEGTKRRRGVIPPDGVGGSNDLRRPSKVFPGHRQSVGSTAYNSSEKDPDCSPPLYGPDISGIDKFKDEAEINFNILRQ